MSLFLISIALILSPALPSSFGHSHRDSSSKREKDLKDLCSDTDKSKDQCWKIIKQNYDSFDTDYEGVVGVAIDLARGKADEILSLLNKLHEDSRDDKLKEKYISCSKNYDDIERDLDQARRYLDSDDYKSITREIDDAFDELKRCRNEFEKKSYDPAHIINRNKEFGVYADIAKAASERWVKRERD